MSANTVTILETFTRQHWPEVKRAVGEEDLRTALIAAQKIQHAYYYAAGLSEYVADLEDTAEAASAVTSLMAALEEGDPHQIENRLRQMGAVAKGWKAQLRKYNWQKGMTAENIMRRARIILNEAAEINNKAWTEVSRAFFSKGPAAAESALAKHRPKKRTASMTALRRQAIRQAMQRRSGQIPRDAKKVPGTKFWVATELSPSPGVPIRGWMAHGDDLYWVYNENGGREFGSPDRSRSVEWAIENSVEYFAKGVTPKQRKNYQGKYTLAGAYGALKNAKGRDLGAVVVDNKGRTVLYVEGKWIILAPTATKAEKGTIKSWVRDGEKIYDRSLSLIR